MDNDDLVFGQKPSRPARRDRRRHDELPPGENHQRGISLERSRRRSGSLTSRNFHLDDDVTKAWNTSIEEQTRLLEEIQRQQQRTATETAAVAAAMPAMVTRTSPAYHQSHMVEEEKFVSSDETQRFSSSSRSSRWEQFSTRHEETSMDFCGNLTTSDNGSRLTKTVRRAKSASAKKSNSSIVDRILTSGGSHHVMSDDDDTSMPDLLPFTSKSTINPKQEQNVMKPKRSKEKKSRIESSSLVDQYVGRQQTSGRNRADSTAERGNLVRRNSVTRRSNEVLRTEHIHHQSSSSNISNYFQGDLISWDTPPNRSRDDLVFGTQNQFNNSETHRVHWSENQSKIEKSKSQGSILRQDSLTNVNSYLPQVPSRKKSFNVSNRDGDDLVFGQRNNSNTIETSRQERRRRSIEKSGSQSNLRRQESLTDLSNFLHEDLNRKWSLNTPAREDLVFGHMPSSNNNVVSSTERSNLSRRNSVTRRSNEALRTEHIHRQNSSSNVNNYLQGDLRDHRRQETNQPAWLERSGSQGNLRRQDSMSNLSNLQDDINSLLRDTTTTSTSSSNVQTSTRCDNGYINSGHRSNYQAIASSLLSEPAPR